MNEQKNNGRGIFYGVIGVATLVVAIIGATFAYFTATASNNTAITGDMATIQFGLEVTKVSTADEEKGGMIPMSNAMVEAAVNGTTAKPNKTDVGTDPQICVDDNGNAVCQIYKISVINSGTAGMYLDGYVTLTNGSGVPTDVASSDWTNITGDTKTTMRWAQVFCTGEDDKLTGCSTAGVTTTGATGTGSGFGTSDWAAVDATSGHNTDQIVKTGDTITANGTISGNTYAIINKNFIRISDRAATATNYDREDDVTSALVFNQFIAASNGGSVSSTTDSDETLTDVQVYYIVVWLSETGTNQTVGASGTNVPASGTNFFQGNVTFNSAQGSEVTATFSGYTAVSSQPADED